ncbi:MAG: glycosyltransferase, partial [Flavobacteriales bacterium]
GNDPGVEKKPGELKLISIARIAPEKNTLGLLELLAEKGKNGTELSLYGPVYDPAYWEKCLAVIAGMPEGVRVEHAEGIPPDEASAAIRRHHAFILLTKGENHGHAIMEALLAGRPVIISDRTPWKKVEEDGVGFMGSLSEKEPFERALQVLSEMDQEEFDRLRARVIEQGRTLKESEYLEEAYQRFFQGDG